MYVVVRLQDPLVVSSLPRYCHQLSGDSYPATLHLHDLLLWHNRREGIRTLRGIQDTVRILEESVH